MKATEQLKAEHEGINRSLRILDAICRRLESEKTVEVQQLEKLIEFFKTFVDRCHHGKEEDLLFPAMERAGIARHGGPIGQMLMEHDRGRVLVRAMTSALDAYRKGDSEALAEFTARARDYSTFLLQHIDKENEILFPLADTCISAEDQDAMHGAFEKLEQQKIGPGVHERFHGLMDEFAEKYL